MRGQKKHQRSRGETGATRSANPCSGFPSKASESCANAGRVEMAGGYWCVAPSRLTPFVLKAGGDVGIVFT